MDKVQGLGSCRPSNLATFAIWLAPPHPFNVRILCLYCSSFCTSQPACAQPPCSGQFFRGLGYRVHFPFLDAFFAEQDAPQALTLSLESLERYYSVTRTVTSLKAVRQGLPLQMSRDRDYTS